MILRKKVPFIAQRVKKRRGRSPLFAPIAFLLIVGALVFAVSVFFRVGSVTVTGNSVYTEEEIIEASGVESGDNLFFINRAGVYSRIYARLPYVEQATVRRSLPNRIEIIVKESEALAVIPSESGLWAIDRKCKLLAAAEGEEARRLILIYGLTALAPAAGQIVAPGEADSPKVDYLSAILTEISAMEMQNQVTEIDMSNVSNPSFDYLGRFTVKLGTFENTDYKFQLLLSAVDSLGSGDRGTIDLSIDKRAHLIYD